MLSFFGPKLAVLVAAVLVSLASAGVAVANDQLPVPWNGIAIGGPSPAGSAIAAGGVYTLIGCGALAGTNDWFHFVY